MIDFYLNYFYYANFLATHFRNKKNQKLINIKNDK